MKLVVTGAGGFLGASVVRAAVMRQIDVCAVSRHPIVPKPPCATEVVDQYGLLAKPEGEAILVHLAGTADIGHANALGWQGLQEEASAFEALAAQDWSRIVLASSGVVYGDKETLARDESEEVVEAGSAYVRLKLHLERTAIERDGLVLRFSNLYGPGMSVANVVSDVLKQMPGAGAIAMRSLSPVRDFLHVEDAVGALLIATERRMRGILNVGSGVGTSIRQLVETALTISGQPDRLVVERVSSEPSSLVLDVQRIRAATGWQHRISLREGLAGLMGAH